MSRIEPSLFGDFKDFPKFFVGFEDQLRRMHSQHADVTTTSNNYPPYNIKKVSDTEYAIELAVAGFSQDDIDIEVIAGKLVIKGDSVTEDKDTPDDFLFHGIASRAFTRSFVLNDGVVVQDAQLLNGMLIVSLEKLVPEEEKPKKIEVRSAEKTLLTE